MMHNLRLTPGGWIQHFLLSQPESGMGYQEIELILKDGRLILNLRVLNCEEILIPPFLVKEENFTETDIETILVVYKTACNNPKP